MDGYKTIKSECSAEIEIKKSRFIATVFPCKTEGEAQEFLNRMRKKYWDARHNVYAFSLRENKLRRFSDDGEPHSTAGLPVMEVINHSGITDIAVVVTRYFGGILLGTGGLVRAYSEAARAVLDAAEVEEILSAKQFKIECEYADYDILNKLLEGFKVKIMSTDFADKISITLGVVAEQFDALNEKCTDTFCGKMPFFDIEDVFLGF